MRLVPVLLCAVAAALCAAAPAGAYTEAQRLAALRCDGVPGAPGTPVLLVPGTGVTAEQNWSWGYARALRDAGHGVCTIDPPDRSTVDVQDSVLYVRTAVEEVARRSGRRMALIGHSQGAFHVVHVLRLFPELAPLVDDVVGLAGLYVRGSDAIRAGCATRCSAAFWQVATGSRYMAALAARPLPAGPSPTAIGTLRDTVVTPQPEVNALPGGRSVQLQDVCPGRRFLDGYDHIYLAADAVGYALAVDALGHPGPAVAQDASRADQQPDLAQVLSAALDDPALRADHHLAPAGVPTQGEAEGLAGELLVEVLLDRVDRDERHVVVTPARRLQQVVATGGLGGGERRPAHPKVSLDGARDP
jgi:hypothetical protein